MAKRSVEIIFTDEAVEEIRRRVRLKHGHCTAAVYYGPTFTGPVFKDVIDTDLSENFMSVTVRHETGGTDVYHYNCTDIRRIKESFRPE